MLHTEIRFVFIGILSGVLYLALLVSDALGQLSAVTTHAQISLPSESSGNAPRSTTSVHPDCTNGIDDDGDGWSDEGDSDCWSGDEGEARFALSVCQDGIDNDGDGLIDSGDEGCENAMDRNEQDRSTYPACSDGRDNDNDGLYDYPFDPGCESKNDSTEAGELRGTEAHRFSWDRLMWLGASTATKRFVEVRDRLGRITWRRPDGDLKHLILASNRRAWKWSTSPTYRLHSRPGSAIGITVTGVGTTFQAHYDDQGEFEDADSFDKNGNYIPERDTKLQYDLVRDEPDIITFHATTEAVEIVTDLRFVGDTIYLTNKLINKKNFPVIVEYANLLPETFLGDQTEELKLVTQSDGNENLWRLASSGNRYIQTGNAFNDSSDGRVYQYGGEVQGNSPGYVVWDKQSSIGFFDMSNIYAPDQVSFTDFYTPGRHLRLQSSYRVRVEPGSVRVLTSAIQAANGQAKHREVSTHYKHWFRFTHSKGVGPFPRYLPEGPLAYWYATNGVSNFNQDHFNYEKGAPCDASNAPTYRNDTSVPGTNLTVWQWAVSNGTGLSCPYDKDLQYRPGRNPRHCNCTYVVNGEPALDRFYPGTPESPARIMNLDAAARSATFLRKNLGIDFFGLWATAMNTRHLTHDDKRLYLSPEVDLIDPALLEGYRRESLVDLATEFAMHNVGYLMYVQPCGRVQGASITYGDGPNEYTVTKGTYQGRGSGDLTLVQRREAALAKMDGLAKYGTRGFYFDAIGCAGDNAFMHYAQRVLEERYGDKFLFIPEGYDDRRSLYWPTIPIVISSSGEPKPGHSEQMLDITPYGTFYGGIVNRVADTSGGADSELLQILSMGFQLMGPNFPMTQWSSSDSGDAEMAQLCSAAYISKYHQLMRWAASAGHAAAYEQYPHNPPAIESLECPSRYNPCGPDAQWPALCPLHQQ